MATGRPLWGQTTMIASPFWPRITLRQRRTDPAWFGRAFAVSMALNYVGTPIGSALAGPLIGWSLDAALWTAVVVSIVAGLFPMLAIPVDEEGSIRKAVRSPRG